MVIFTPHSPLVVPLSPQQWKFTECWLWQESAGSAVRFKNPWCQTHIFLGEHLISCIVPGNPGLRSGQQRIQPHPGPPGLVEPPMPLSTLICQDSGSQIRCYTTRFDISTLSDSMRGAQILKALQRQIQEDLHLTIRWYKRNETPWRVSVQTDTYPCTSPYDSTTV